MAIFEELGSKEGIANQYGNLGNVAQDRDDLNAAEDWYYKALALNEELGSKMGEAIQCTNIGILEEKRGRIEQARELWRRSLSLNAEIGATQEIEKVSGWHTDLGDGADVSDGE